MSQSVDRIRKIMHEKNISIRGLGVMTGIPTATMSRYIGTETQKIPIDKLQLIAEALNTTPAYLMGWEEEQKPNSPDETNLTEGERMLLELFRRIPEEKQQMALQMLRAALLEK